MQAFDDAVSHCSKIPPPVDKKNNILEIHGNCNYMRCDRECSTELFTIPDVLPSHDPALKCPKCGGLARPHILLFDENYNEKHYKSDSAWKTAEKMDCLIVAGSALETNLASKIVGHALQKGIPLVEVNPKTLVEWGNTYLLQGTLEEHVPGICQNIAEKVLAEVQYLEPIQEENKNVRAKESLQSSKPLWKYTWKVKTVESTQFLIKRSSIMVTPLRTPMTSAPEKKVFDFNQQAQPKPRTAVSVGRTKIELPKVDKMEKTEEKLVRKQLPPLAAPLKPIKKKNKKKVQS